MRSSSILLLFTISMTTVILHSFHAFQCRCCKYLVTTRRWSSSNDFSSVDVEKYKSIITSDSNERVKLLKSLDIKKKRDASQLILLEGHRQIIDALTAFEATGDTNMGGVPIHIMVSKKAFNAPLGKTLDKALSKSTYLMSTVSIISESILKDISDTVNNQGIVAAFSKPKPQYTSIDELLQKKENFLHEKKPLILILDHVADPGNIGTIVRSSYGLGVDAIVIIDGCDPWSPKVLRASMGTCLKLPIFEMSQWTDFSTAISFFNKDSYQILLAECDNIRQSVVYSDVAMEKATFIVIGSESVGISEEIKRVPDAKLVYIPMLRKLESYNAAVAAAIIVSECTRQRALKKKEL